MGDDGEGEALPKDERVGTIWDIKRFPGGPGVAGRGGSRGSVEVVLASTSSNLTEGLGSSDGTKATAICCLGPAKVAEPTAAEAGIPRGVSLLVRTYSGVPRTSTRSDRAMLLSGLGKADEAEDAGTRCSRSLREAAK
jgi:hypothetical protein